MTKLFKILVFVILFFLISSQVISSAWYRAYIPEQIGIKLFSIAGSEWGTREGCGPGIFYLTEKSAAEIATQKLAYFKTARKARSTNLKYTEWKETPLIPKAENAAEEISAGLGCANNISAELRNKINRAMDHEGGYYAFAHESTILVLPALGLVVFGSVG